MTWTVAAFTILFLALAAGFAWYERTQPSAKTLALVATLAALAVLGRVAFAPLPNVKPTTDIIVLAGFALGGAPGFAVGAVTAITSNLMFGEGPWTPWQMVAWGLCGVLGAGLARLTRGRVSRWQLALTCAFAGLAYGVLLDLQDWLQYAPERTVAQYLARSAGSAPFNAAHIIGNVVFALAFAPALLKILARFRARTEITWLAPAAAVAVTALAVAPPAADAASVSSKALTYLSRAQNRDGGWGAAKGQSSSPLYTSWAVIGQGATGHCNARAVARVAADSHHLSAPGDVERTILALRACHHSAGTLPGALAKKIAANGSIGGLTNITSFGIFALRAAGVSKHDKRISRAATFVAKQQNRDGGWSFSTKGSTSDVDDTAAATQALIAAGRSSTTGPVKRAIAYLRARQGADGGFGGGSASGSNAQSTSWAIQAFAAAHVDLAHVTRNGSRNPVAYLRTLVAGDGSVRYSRTSTQTPVWVTAQALTGLARTPFPIV